MEVMAATEYTTIEEKELLELARKRVKKIKNFYKEKEGLQKMSYQITEDKVFKYILNGSTVNEVAAPAKA